MKQFFALLVLVSCLAYGQHTNAVTQSGPNNDSYVVQEFVGSGTFFQGNEATVAQIGSTNFSDVYQNNNGYAGSKEMASVYQYGDQNIATVDQLNDGHQAAITSVGNWNEAYSYQNGNKTLSTIYQDGNSNYGRIHIQADDQTPHTFASIGQYGGDNTAIQIIGGDWSHSSGKSHFVSQQVGNSNQSFQYMEADKWIGGVDDVGNTGDVTQIGDANYSLQDMKIGGLGFNCANNNADLYQEGNFNTSVQLQDRNNNSSVVNQTGNGNYSFSDQN